ncbi:MAG TPA: ribosome maturation factor RimM [Rhizomicrobium sp.]|nr:ribosome maturation factor RimM [Rhizomicrobium sp.]
MAGQSRDVLLAAVIGAQGLKGEVKVKTFTSAPGSVGAYGPLHSKDGRRFTVTAVRSSKEGEAVVSLADINDRDAAEALKGTELYVPRAALPAADGDEFYHADLIGLRAEDEQDRLIGTVKAIHNYGAGDVIEIDEPGGDSLLLAFTRETVPRIELELGRIVIAIPHEIDDERANYTE